MSTGPPIGAEFAGYRIEALLGRGGTGAVFRAQDLRLPRKVALKILTAGLADDELFRERFMRESQLAATIDHPHIVPVYEAGEADGQLFIAMRHVQGGDLRGLLRREGRLDPERALALLEQAAGAIDAAHACGLCHRDVKPGNILVAAPTVAAAEHVYLADFGLTLESGSSTRYTREGLFVGTIDYASPEQIAGEPVGDGTDIYALGCVLYECLAGTPPHPRGSVLAAMQAHLFDSPPLLSAARPDLPAALDGVVAVALARRPGDRHPTAAALVDAARRALRGEATTITRGVAVPAGRGAAPAPAERRVPPLAAVALVAILVVGLAVVLVLRHSPGAGGDPAEPPLPSSEAAATGPPPSGLSSHLLTADLLGTATATAVAPGLRIADITCGAPPTAAVEEQRVAFRGLGARAGRGYYEAVARFASVDDATAYMASVAAEVQRCPQRAGQPPAPHLGNESLRLLFANKAGDVTFDNTYVRSGAQVCVVLVSMSGSTPPPDDDVANVTALAVAQLAGGS